MAIATEAVKEGGGALGRFAHNNLLKGASASAATHMINGAGAGAALGAVGSVTGMGPTGDDGIIGGAMHGAIMGAAGGALTRGASMKYADGVLNNAGKDLGQGFKVSHFTNVEGGAHASTFWGDTAGMADKTKGHMMSPNAGAGKAPMAGAPSANKGPMSQEDKANNMRAKATRNNQVMRAKNAVNNYNNGTAGAASTPRQSVQERMDALNASKADRQSKEGLYGTNASEGTFALADSGNSRNAQQAAAGFGAGMPSPKVYTDAWEKQVGPVKPKGKK